MILPAAPASDSYPRFSWFSTVLWERSLAGRRCHWSCGQRLGGGSCCEAERQQVAATGQVEGVGVALGGNS